MPDASSPRNLAKNRKKRFYQSRNSREGRSARRAKSPDRKPLIPGPRRKQRKRQTRNRLEDSDALTATNDELAFMARNQKISEEDSLDRQAERGSVTNTAIIKNRSVGLGGSFLPGRATNSFTVDDRSLYKPEHNITPLITDYEQLDHLYLPYKSPGSSTFSLLSFAIPLAMLAAAIPASLAFAHSPAFPGDYTSADFYALISSAILQLIGLFLIVYPFYTLSRKADGRSIVFVWIWALMSGVATVASVPLFVGVGRNWAGIVSFLGNVGQVLVVLQLVGLVHGRGSSRGWETEV